MDIHARADELVRQSHGKLSHRQALQELARRSAASRQARRNWMDRRCREAVESPAIRLPYADN